MVWPIIAVGALLGAGAGYMATGDAKGLIGGGLLGAFTGGMGGAALGGIGAASAATGVTGATTAGTLGATTAATTVPGLAVGTGGVGVAGLGGKGAGLMAALQGSGQVATTGAGLAMGTPAYTAPALANAPWIGSSAVGQQAAAVGEQAITGKDFSKLGDAVQQSIKEEPEESIDARLLDEQAPLGRGDSSIQAELDASARNIARQERVTPSGLSGVTQAARGGIMRVPSGSLTGGLLVGPGTGTSDSISSAIFPDIASKLGASSMQAIQGGGHAVQRAALSDGEYVLTAKAVKGFGKQAGAPPGQEREYGSKLLDNVMNQMQRV